MGTDVVAAVVVVVVVMMLIVVGIGSCAVKVGMVEVSVVGCGIIDEVGRSFITMGTDVVAVVVVVGVVVMLVAALGIGSCVVKVGGVEVGVVGCGMIDEDSVKDYNKLSEILVEIRDMFRLFSLHEWQKSQGLIQEPPPPPPSPDSPKISSKQ
jgi:hypothetical protein